MTKMNQQGRRTESHEGKDEVEPILLQERLFWYLHDRITSRRQWGRNTKLWSIKGATVRRGDLT
jgi:hypothetical protein